MKEHIVVVRTLLLSAIILFLVTNATAQPIIPIDSNPGEKFPVQIFGHGSGSISANDGAQEAYALGALIRFWPSRHLPLIVAFDKGTASNIASVDSINLKSILFPEASDLGFLIAIYPSKEYEGTWKPRIGVLAGFQYQPRTIRRDNYDHNFEVTSTQVGFRGSLAHTGEADKNTNSEAGNSFQCYANVSYKWLSIPASGAQAFRASFNDVSLPLSYSGTCAKIGVVINEIGFEFEWNNLYTFRTRDAPGITGAEFMVRAAVTPKAWVF